MKNTETKDFDISIDGFIPKGSFMLVDPLEFKGEQQTKSGIVIPDNVTQATPTLAKVLKSGPDAMYKPGAVVIFRRYSLDEITVKVSTGKKKLHFVDNDDIIAEYKMK